MQGQAGVIALLTAGALMGGPAIGQPAGAGVHVEHAAARLVVIAEPRNNVSVTVEHGSSGLPPLQVRREGDMIVVDGGLARPFGGDRLRCVGGWNIHPAVRLFGGPVTHVSDNRAVVVDGVGRVNYGDLPVITAHVPMDASLATTGAVWGEVGATDRLHLVSTGCGAWTAGPVRGVLDTRATGSGDISVVSAGVVHAALAGSGDVTVGPIAGPADLSLAGSGDVRIGPVGGPLKASLAGSGDINVAQANGPVLAHIASNGDIHIHGGAVPVVEATVAGSGDITFDGTAGRVSASVVGSGNVRVAHVTGPVSKSVVGSGEVTVGN
jgi:hypothetical protein